MILGLNPAAQRHRSFVNVIRAERLSSFDLIFGCGTVGFAPDHCVEAPSTRALRSYVEKNETEKNSGHALVLNGPVTAWEMKLPVRDRHHAGENERYRTS